MKREEAQELLERFGFSMAFNQKIGDTDMYHVIQQGSRYREMVEYRIDRALGEIINSIWGFRDQAMSVFDNMDDFEEWLRNGNP